MASLIPRALSAMLAPLPTLPVTMPHKPNTVPLLEIVIDTATGVQHYIIVKRPLVHMVFKTA
jgi:hypothetical protein